MKLTPLDIKKQEFRRVLRGYDPEEVEAFLEMVAEEYEGTIREKNELADEVLKLRTQLRDYQEVERTLKETLMTAQQTITESRESSKREADLIIREAQVKADEILDDARKELSRLKNEILMLRTQKESLSRRLRHLLESQLELLGVLEIEDVAPEAQARKQPAAAPKATGNRFEIVAHEEKAADDAARGSETVPEGEPEDTGEKNEGPVIY
ncbi:MAG: DivIVA domain-containing protein [Calditrichaeota bacterium]|nr:DivIVA domain-containing protein [Calditrichota bacterium]